MHKRPFFCAWMFLAGSITLVAQQIPFVINIWQVQDDLPNNDVREVIQTRSGYIWVATAGGIGRYTGVHFGIQFNTLNEGKAPVLPNNFFCALGEDEAGALWLGLETGDVLCSVAGVVTPISLPKAWPRAPIKRFMELSPGKMLALSREGVLVEISTNEPAQSRLLTNTVAGRTLDLVRERDGSVWALQENGIRSLTSSRQFNIPGSATAACAAREGGLWVLSNGHLCRWQQERLVEERARLPVPDGEVSCLAETPDHSLLIGCVSQGLLLLSPSGTFQHFDATQGLTSDNITCLCVDHESSVWVGTGSGGLMRLGPRRASTVTIPFLGPAAHLLSIASGSTNDVWITDLNHGLLHFTGDAAVRVALSPALNGKPLCSLQRKNSGAIWLGTSGYGLWVLNGEKCDPLQGWPWTNATIHCLYTDPFGKNWAGLSDGLVVLNSNNWERVMDGSAPISDDIRCLIGDTQGNLWVGTLGAGLYRIHGSSVTRFSYEQGLRSINLLALASDLDGTLWAGTHGGGLARIREGQITTLTTKEGLPHDTICQIMDDGKGRIWLAMPGNLAAFEKADLNNCADGKSGLIHPLIFDLSAGFSAVDFVDGNQPEAIMTADRRLWFVASKGLGVVSPEDAINRRNQLPPPIIIEHILANEVEVLAESFRDAKHLQFPAGTDRLEFRYNALSYIAPRRVRFQYQLQGLDNNWVDSGSSRTVRFAHLPPGDYTFRVKGCNNDGVWNENGAQLAFSILPYYWQTLKFKTSMTLLAVISVAGITYAFARLKHRSKLLLAQQKENLERERVRIARDMHDEVGAKLTRITILSQLASHRTSSPETRAKSLTSLTHAARECVRRFDQIVWTVNPRNDSLQQVADYLVHCAVAYFENTSIECRFDQPNNLPDLPVSSTVRNNLLHACEEAMNNTLKHSKASVFSLSMAMEKAGDFVIVLGDNGVWLPRTKPHVADGLQNMRQRMSDIGGECIIEQHRVSGTEVRFILHLHNI
jgi:signal transduction histidine kinase/ligand-binding sensor domain-containing protein